MCHIHATKPQMLFLNCWSCGRISPHLYFFLIKAKKKKAHLANDSTRHSEYVLVKLRMLCACIKEEECHKLLSSTCFNVCLISVWFACTACVHPPVTHVTACNIHAGPQRHRAWLRPGLGFSCSLLCVVVLKRSSRLLSDQRSGGLGPAPCRERGSVYVGRLLSTAAHAPACLDKQKYDPCKYKQT